MSNQQDLRVVVELGLPEAPGGEGRKAFFPQKMALPDHVVLYRERGKNGVIMSNEMSEGVHVGVLEVEEAIFRVFVGLVNVLDSPV